jgi:hypothetical protein
MSEILSEKEFELRMPYGRKRGEYRDLLAHDAAMRALVGRLADALERKCTCHHLPTLLNFHTTPNGDGTVTRIICGLSRDELDLLASARSATGEKA